MIEKSTRKDKVKNIDKVAASLAKNPLQTEKELCKDTGLGKWTVWRAKKEVGEYGEKDFRIQNLLDKDMELMDLIQQEKFNRLKENKINDTDIDRWENTATKRKAIFGNNNKEKVNENITIQI